MNSSLSTAALYLVNTLFDLYLFALAFRLILAFERANYFNPITRFIITITQPIVGFLRKIFPTLGGIELSTLFFMIILEIIKYLLISLIMLGAIANPAMLVILALTDGLKLFLNIFFFAILIQAILSWVQMAPSPVTQVLNQLSAPIMRPLRAIIPSVGGFDITPIPALIILQLLIILI